MKKVSTWFQTHLSIFKFIFMITVLLIVGTQILHLAKSISFQQVAVIFTSIPIWRLISMIVIGLVAIFPMIGYDWMLNDLLKLNQSRPYLLETSWIINTINNIAGFGGLISVGLRIEFYGKGQKRKEIATSLTKIMLFSMAGLSIFSLLALLSTFLFHSNTYIRQYWLWLIGGGLYFPLLYLVTTRKKSGYFSGLSNLQGLQLTLTSFLEWGGSILTFLSIGKLLNISVSSWGILSLFVAANVIGIVSLIPGGIGSFDLIMLLGLTALKIDHETAALWLLLYRLCYYIVPVIIALILFFIHGFQNFDHKYQGIPKQLIHEVFHKIVVFSLYFSGFLMVLSVTMPEIFTDIAWLHKFSPVNFHWIVQVPSILAGFALLILGRGMAAQVKKVYLPTIILLIALLIYTLFLGFLTITTFFFALLLLFVIEIKPELYREQLVYAWEWIIKDGLTFGSLIFSYLVIGMYQFPVLKHHPFKHYSKFFILPSEQFWLRGFLGIGLALVLIFLILSFLQGSKTKIDAVMPYARVQNILQNYGGNSDSELVFAGDKSVFIYNNGQDDSVFLQFRTLNNKCIVMGDPSGKKADFADAIETFIAEADRLCYVPVFYEVSEKIVLLLHEFGYDFIKMGENAIVDLNGFTTSGKKMRGIRAIINKMDKAGYTFEVVAPPFEATFMNEIKHISDAWLENRVEKGFSMGSFSNAYLSRNPIAVVKDVNGKIVSFANIIPSFTEKIGTVDLMRHDSAKAPSGSMDFLFVHLFEWMKNAGIKNFDLGMAPFANVGRFRKSFRQERLASLIYSFGNRFYSFQGLREYKEKYVSYWIPRYTLYSRDSWITCVMIALLIVENQPIASQK